MSGRFVHDARSEGEMPLEPADGSALPPVSRNDAEREAAHNMWNALATLRLRHPQIPIEEAEDLMHKFAALRAALRDGPPQDPPVLTDEKAEQRDAEARTAPRERFTPWAEVREGLRAEEIPHETSVCPCDLCQRIRESVRRGTATP